MRRVEISRGLILYSILTFLQPNDFTRMVKGFSFSLEFSQREGPNSRSESGFFLLIGLYARSYDISKCYTQVITAGDFLHASLNIYDMGI